MVFTLYRHEVTQHGVEETTTHEEGFQEDNKQDYIYNYTAVDYNLFFFLNLTDATREGDAERLIRCFQFALLVEYQFCHTKYAYLLLHFFAKVYALLSKREAMCLVHNRFFNSEGKKGGNKPLDLQMEHLNFLLKMVLKSLSGHNTQRSAQRVARSLGTLEKIMDSIRKEMGLKKGTGHHGIKGPDEAVKIIVTDLLNANVFNHPPGRDGYPSFKKMKESIVDLDFRDFF